MATSKDELVIGRVLYWDKFKYIYNKNDIDELYDLEQDANELNSLIDEAEYASLLRTMKERLIKNQKQSGDLEELITI